MHKLRSAPSTARALATSIGAALLAASALVAACGKPGPTLRQPVGVTTITSAPEGEARGDGGAPYTPAPVELYLAQQAPGPCGMDRLPSVEFEFGSSDLAPPEDLRLSELARCVTEDPFDAAEIVLVGHADPIGSPTYNLDLAYDRALRVKNRLVALGVRAERIVVTSAGESPLPPSRWAEARRVDIVLARPEAASPPGR